LLATATVLIACIVGGTAAFDGIAALMAGRVREAASSCTASLAVGGSAVIAVRIYPIEIGISGSGLRVRRLLGRERTVPWHLVTWTCWPDMSVMRLRLGPGFLGSFVDLAPTRRAMSAAIDRLQSHGASGAARHGPFGRRP
jgi:hypothetical protein